MNQDIEHSTLYEARKLIENLRNENLEWCRQDKSQDSLRIIRENIFNEKTHFILELIQNADDCFSDKVIFNLFSSRLIIENTGNSFDEKNVEALSNIGRSTKGEDHIGFFGIGFKSVFQVTNVPEIHSGLYHFRYDNQNLIVPEWIEESEWNPSSGSIFVLPLKKEKPLFREIEKQLKKFDGSVLLFLKHLKNIRVKNITLKIEPFENSKNTFTLFKDGKEISHWKKYSVVLKIPQSKQKTLQIDRGRRWSKKNQEEIAISFQVDKKGLPLTNRKGRLFAFFPTQLSSGLQFNLQADFLVPLTRTTLQNPTGKWNQWILKNAYRPIAKLIKDFKNTSILKTAFYSLLPKENELNHDYLEPVKKGIDKYISENSTIYTANRKWVKPSKALIPDAGISSLIEQKHLKNFFKTTKYYVSQEIDEHGLEYLREHLEQFTYHDLFENVFSNTEWIKNRPLKWFIRLYARLWDWVQSKGNYGTWEWNRAIDLIKKSSIFLSESKKLMAIKEKRRHLYRLEQEQGDFASLFKNEYELLNQKLYTKILSDATKNAEEKKARDKARKLIREVVPIVSVEKIFTDIIKPALLNWENHTDAKLLRYTDFVRRFIEDKKVDMILLRKEGDLRNYLKPSHMFLPPEYGVDSILRKLFHGIDVSFISNHYIQKLTKRSSDRSRDQIASWKRFFQKIGVNERPTIEVKTKNSYHADLAKELEKYYPNRRIENSNWGYKKRDFEFIRALSEIIDSLQDNKTPDSLEKAKLLLRVINKNWDYYKNYLVSFYQYHVINASRWSQGELGPSAIALIIREKSWVPTLSGNLVKPSHVFLNLQTIKEAMGDQVEYVDGVIENRSLIKFAGFNDRPSVKAALNHIRGLIDRKVDDYDSFRRSYIFFRDFLKDRKSSVKDRDLIIKAFKSEPLIFVPGHKTQPYRKHAEVVWSGPSFLNDFKPNLERYFDMETFFIDQIGIGPEPTTNDYVNFLIYLSTKQKVTILEQEAILSAYGKLDDALVDENKGRANENKRSNKQLKMWGSLQKKGKIWCMDKSWSSFADELYYNDNEYIYNIFKDMLKIIYYDLKKRLKLPRNFFEEFGIKGLRQSVREIALEIDEEVLREASQEEIEKIRSIAPYICGFIKKADPKCYEKLNQRNTFSRLSSIDAKIVGRIKTYFEINGIQRANPDEKRAFYNLANNTLYLTGGLRDCEDDIGISFSDALENIPGMIDFISRLISLDEFERQNIIHKRKIEWIEINEESKGFNKAQTDEPKETHKDNGDNEKKEKRIHKERIHPVSQENKFNALEFLKEIESSLKSIPIKKINDSDLQEISQISRQTGSRGGGGRLWSGLTDEQKKQIGSAAEKIVYRKEKMKLKELFENGLIQNNLSERVDYIAERDDTTGYDIQSWNEDGEKMYIEVKGTPDIESMEFPISRDEFKKAEEIGDRYFIYRVLNVRKEGNPSIIVLKNPFKLWRKNKLSLVSKNLLMSVKLN